MKCRHPGLNFACTQRRDGKFLHTPMHVCTLTPPHAHSGSLVWLSIRLTHQAGEAKSDPAVKCLNMQASLYPHLAPLNPHTHIHTHAISFLMCRIPRLRKTQKQPNKPTPQLDGVSYTISTFSVCVSYCHNNNCVCIPLTPIFVCSSCSHLSQGQAFEEA